MSAVADRHPASAWPSPADPRWQLVQRVAESAAFQKSPRLREFLLFVCERALADPRSVVHEHDIGAAVFGRPSGFMAGEDTLVRVHASRLRKRLEQYFATEGAGEPVVLLIPKHSYMPVFRPREEAAGAHAPDGSGAAAGSAHALLALTSGLALALLLAATWLFVENRALRRRLDAGLARGPTVDRLWRQMFGDGAGVSLVLADSNLTMLEDLLRRQLSPFEYQQKQFRLPPERTPKDPLGFDIANRLMTRQFTSIADAALAHRLGLLSAAHGIPTEVISARDAGPQLLKSSHHAVLAGPRRANPWIDLFEERLNFRSRFDEDRRRAFFENVAPRPGEQPSYQVTWNRAGYCRVAYLPNLDRTGTILLLSGTEMGSTEAAVEFITSEHWLHRFGSALGVPARGRFPYFEVLLRTRLLASKSPEFTMIAHRGGLGGPESPPSPR